MVIKDSTTEIHQGEEELEVTEGKEMMLGEGEMKEKEEGMA